VTGVSVCLSVCTHISGITQSNFTKFSVHVSAFVDDVMFYYNGPYGGVMPAQQPGCNVVHGLTPLLRGIDGVPSWTTVGAKARRVLRAKGARGRVYDTTVGESYPR